MVAKSLNSQFVSIVSVRLLGWVWWELARCGWSWLIAGNRAVAMHTNFENCVKLEHRCFEGVWFCSKSLNLLLPALALASFASK